MMDKINRPPVQCTVIRKDELGRLPLLADIPRAEGTLVTVEGISIPPSIQAHIDKVSKMRIFQDAPSQPRQ